ncbi:Dynein_light chain [Hexamita inflata]|uniref:Dynein axonemal light chain 4 n=1 Tax=Hexamita inflata TaxID=28002 RepID=A0AA86PHV9_9EUKA|nr:Dynein light chain [Hexamita inflata]CAI9937503.1 Dynein light chain [Hexamita inflata]CAI9945924.1 Dynein light chain [Hexamita inflata]
MDEDDEQQKNMNQPLLIECDMADEERIEATEICVTACEKFPGDPAQCSKMIKEQLDKKFGSFFHVIVGNAYGFTIESEVSHKLQMAYGYIGILVFKG